MDFSPRWSLKDCEWLDPVDCSNNVALQLSNTTWAALRQYIKVTLDIFVQRPMFVPRAALPSIMSQQTIIATCADHAMNVKSGERVLLNIYATTGDRASAAKSEISKLVAENTSLLKPFDAVVWEMVDHHSVMDLLWETCLNADLQLQFLPTPVFAEVAILDANKLALTMPLQPLATIRDIVGATITKIWCSIKASA